MATVRELSQHTGTAQACAVMHVPRASYYRTLRPKMVVPRRPSTPARALSEMECQDVIELLHSDRFVDRAPAEVYATLLDEGTYHCSERSMYRILERRSAVRERRDHLRHPEYRKPELLATGPNQVWSWDITKLRGPGKWEYYCLYVVLDIYSRCVVGWLVAHHESASLAHRLLDETCDRQGIVPEQLTVHSDRGQVMRSKTVAQLLADLVVTKTHSRPHVSDDNPFSESQFKTLKYAPSFPRRFGSLEDAKSFLRRFFHWYNEEHRHSGIGLMTPAAVHRGSAPNVLAARQRVLDAAFDAHPERFVRGRPKPQGIPEAVWINKPVDMAKEISTPACERKKVSGEVETSQNSCSAFGQGEGMKNQPSTMPQDRRSSMGVTSGYPLIEQASAKFALGSSEPLKSLLAAQ